jgi:hypothetical protein
MHTEWMNSFRIPFTTLVSYVPVIATLVTCFFSVILARATLRYVEATDKGLALAREEFEREWSPELHIKLERVSSSEARIVVTNLAKASVLLQMAQMRKLTHIVPSERWFLNDPLVGGMTWTQDISKRLLGTTENEFEGAVVASMTFYAAGRMYRTDWFRFNVHIKDGRISKIDPSNIPARRVRVIERKGNERREDMVHDVAGGVPVKVDTKPDEKFFEAEA